MSLFHFGAFFDRAGREGDYLWGRLDAAERLEKQMDVQLDGRIVQARDAGAAIVDEAEALHSDAIVLGVAYHRPYGRFEVGELALHVLENARAQVWLIRYPPEADQLG